VYEVPAIVCAVDTAGSASVPISLHRLTHAVFSGVPPAPVSDALILTVPPALKKNLAAFADAQVIVASAVTVGIPWPLPHGAVLVPVDVISVPDAAAFKRLVFNILMFEESADMTSILVSAVGGVTAVIVDP
jgi:hypothetical protein